MSAAIAGSAGAAGRLLYKGVRSCSRSQFLRVRAQRPAIRSLSASTKVYEKRYTEDHEWVELASGSSDTATIGISEYAAKALGDVVYVELPTVDLEVNKGDAIGAVESVKSASDIMTPVSGTIKEVNNILEEKPATINKSPEADGWLAKIAVSDPKELEDLMDGESYRKFTEEVDSK